MGLLRVPELRLENWQVVELHRAASSVAQELFNGLVGGGSGDGSPCLPDLRSAAVFRFSGKSEMQVPSTLEYRIAEYHVLGTVSVGAEAPNLRSLAWSTAKRVSSCHAAKLENARRLGF